MADPTQPTTNTDAFSARMFDHDAGQYIDVPAHQVTDAVKSGRYTFGAGIKIPTVNAQGELSETPAEAAYNDFVNHGVTFATPQLKQNAEQRQQQDIQQDNFGNQPLTAALAGAFREGTLGGSSVALSAMGLGDAAKSLAEQNPGADLVGGIVGGGAVLAGTGGLGGLGEGVAAAAGKGLAEAGASKAVQTIAPIVAREAVVGSVFGAGSGISEQALGHPDDVVDNIVSHVGMGALFGGALGGVFGTTKVARPYFDSLVEKATEGGKTLANKAVSSVMSGRVTAALNRAGEEEAAQSLGALAKDPDAIRIFSEKGPNAAAKVAQENADVISDLKDHISTLQKDLRSGLKDASQQTKETVAQAVQEAGGNIFDANTQVYRKLNQAQRVFDTTLQTMTQPLEESSTVAERFNDAVDVLKGSDTPLARNIGTKVDNMLRTTPFNSVGDEAGFLYNVRNKLKNINIDGLDAPTKNVVSSLMEEADQSLLTNPSPAISEGYKAIKGLEDASDKMRDVADRTVNKITNTAVDGERVADAGYTGSKRAFNEDKLARTLVDPRLRATTAAVLENLQEFAPEINQAAQGLKTVEDQIAFQNALEAKMSQIAPKGHIDGADVQSVLDQLGSPKDLSVKLEKVIEAQKIMDQPSAIDRVIAAKQALGQPVSKEILAVGKYQHQFDYLNKLADAQVMSMNPLRLGRAAFKLMHGNVGGALMDAALGVQKSSVKDAFNVISSVQKASAQGAQIMQKAIKGAANALTGSGGQTVAKAVTYGTVGTMKEQRKQYPQMEQMLTQPPQPHPLSQHAPQLAQAFQQRQQQVTAYLTQNLPQDPLKENAILPSKTGYIPSDQELSSFNRRVQAANNPMQVLENIRQNTVSPEEIETLKTLNPGIFQKLQTSVIDGIVNGKSDLSYQKKIQLGTLLNIPTDYSLRPDFTARMQQAMNHESGGRPEGSGPQRKIQIDIKPETSVATDAQQTTYGLKREPA